tara:strand:+ start:1468 stop:1836 length:369 start_codon:yes stop_codon:yes gene_type:complete
MSTIYYTEEHEWLRVDGDIATVGITDHAQEQLGDLVFVDLPSTGATVGQGDDVVVVESVKAASDVYAPASGEIIEVNDALTADAALVNSDAEGKGWLYKMKLSKPEELDKLMDQAAYKAQIS